MSPLYWLEDIKEFTRAYSITRNKVGNRTSFDFLGVNTVYLTLRVKSQDRNGKVCPVTCPLVRMMSRMDDCTSGICMITINVLLKLRMYQGHYYFHDTNQT